MKIVSFTLRDGNKYVGSIDGQEFAIGRRVSFEGNKGLMNISGTAEQRYQRDEYRPLYGLWADLIHPTAVVEGALYHTLNTYDRAHFTFTFLQFAAHVPEGDFVQFFRALLKLPQAEDYFPDLQLKDGRICRISEHGLQALESSSSTEALMRYLNPSTAQVEDTEVIQAARFIHWSQNDLAHRQTQIEVGIRFFKEKMARYAQQYRLDGAADSICLVVADIRHQGRARSPEIASALASAEPLRALLKIGESRYPQRVGDLRREVEKLTAEGTLGEHVYSRELGDFVPR
ncbi:MAG: hypothetical protein ABWY06_08530 [Pseudomonas sp.]|uniref:hypothetical protein n=1 Tax=Pseudomonas sp. TaxID=306 RepID=UPI00339398D5